MALWRVSGETDPDLWVVVAAHTLPLGLIGRPFFKSKAGFWSAFDTSVFALIARMKDLGEHTFRLAYEHLHGCQIDLMALSLLINQVQHIILNSKVSIAQLFWALP